MQPFLKVVVNNTNKKEKSFKEKVAIMKEEIREMFNQKNHPGPYPTKTTKK